VKAGANADQKAAAGGLLSADFLASAEISITPQDSPEIPAAVGFWLLAANFSSLYPFLSFPLWIPGLLTIGWSLAEFSNS